jgi:sugar lactone lactonase YvrE
MQELLSVMRKPAALAVAVISDLTELAVPRAALGEGPCWDAKAGTLYWTDIPAHRVHRLTGDGTHTEWDAGQPVGAVVPRAGGGLVLAARDGFLAMDPHTGSLTMLTAVEPDMPGNRMNDGACDRAGRFFAGTMAEDESPGAGALYLLAADHQVTRLFAGVGISNGIGWSPDDQRMYYIDSLTYRVDVFDYEPGTGAIGNRRTFASLGAGGVMPDGLAVDSEGSVWVALWGGSGLRRYAPGGRLTLSVDVPAANVTSCAFGGPDLRTLYITTAAGPGRSGGALFACQVAVAGLPANPYRG